MQHSKQISQLLQLVAAQLELSKLESEQPIESLSSSFIELANIAAQLSSLENSEHAQHKALIDSLNEKVQQGVVALQFYDRLFQRLVHVQQHLNLADELVESQHRVDDWHNQFGKLKQSYSMESERAIFDLISRGVTAEDAINQVAESTIQQLVQANDIELF